MCKTIRSSCGAFQMSKQPYNKGLERTRRVGVPAARAVIRVSPRRSTQCCTDRGTDRKILVPPPSAVADAHPCYPAQTAPAWKALVRPFSGVGLLSEIAQPSSNIMLTAARPSRFHRHHRASTSVIKRLVRRITIGTSKLCCARPHNKALHQPRRQGVPASRAVVEGRLAGEGRC